MCLDHILGLKWNTCTVATTLIPKKLGWNLFIPRRAYMSGSNVYSNLSNSWYFRVERPTEQHYDQKSCYLLPKLIILSITSSEIAAQMSFSAELFQFILHALFQTELWDVCCQNTLDVNTSQEKLHQIHHKTDASETLWSISPGGELGEKSSAAPP